jgi:photosystem II stability/assembly factor-like uncharacterized protein
MDGNHFFNKKLKYMKKINIILIILFSVQILSADWILTGPGKTTVSAICKDGQVIYAASKGRVYSSTNYGDSWKLLNDYSTQHFDEIFDLVINKNKIFVGTYFGLFTTTDFGKTWILDSINGNAVIYDIKRNKENILVIAGGQLYISYDNGISWEQISPDYWGVGLTFTVDGENIYVGGYGSEEKPDLWISHDYGKNWKRITDTLTGLKAKEFLCIAAKDNYIYAGTKDDGLFISSDYGETWTRTKEKSFNYTFAYNILCKKDTVFACTDIGLLFSTNNGQDWSYLNFIDVTRDIIVDDTAIFLASDGLAISKDNGKNWEVKTGGLGSAYIFDLTLHKNTFFATAYKQGVYESSDDCKTWNRFTGIYDNASLNKIEFLDSNIFTTRSYTGLLEFSNDFGITWKVVDASNGIPNMNVFTISVDSEKKNVFVGNQTGLYISKDFGNHWELVNEDLKIIPITQIIIVGDIIYVTANQYNMYISYDYGKTFKTYNTDNGLPYDSYYTAMELCGSNIIIGTYYLGSSGKPKGIFFSKDNGVTWNPVNINSPFNNIIDLISFDSFVFAGSDSGIFVSSDCGENWIIPINNLKNLQINN